MDDVTLLICDKKRFMKTIHHRPSIGLPILTVNESLQPTLKREKIDYPICQPCYPKYMHTSTAAWASPSESVNIIGEENGTTPTINERNPEHVHIIPLDTNDIRDNDVHHTSLDDASISVPEGELVEDDPSEIPEANPVESIQREVSDQELLQSLKSTNTPDEKELLMVHHKLKHLPEKYLHGMAAQGIIPKKFQKVKLPQCPACILAKQHKRPWRSKGKQRHIRNQGEIHPGNGTSVDQLESRHPGLVPQTKGFHRTTERYVGATIFVDHATGFTYVHHIKDFTGEQAIETKHAYETKCAQHGVRIRGYHGDNGRFAEALWLNDAVEKNQRMTFCGVGSHHQNGIAEKKIRDLTEYARTLLIHGGQIWPEAVKLALWPYALKEAERVFNELRVDAEGLTPLQRFAKIRDVPELKHEHPLFCPVFALDANLQGTGSLPRWEPRSRAGVYLGRSKHHASSVALVLNLETGNVSPQYHLTFDDTFSTVEYLRKKEEPPFWIDLVKTQTEFYDASCMESGTLPEVEQSAAVLRELREAFLDNIEYPSRPPQWVTFAVS